MAASTLKISKIFLYPSHGMVSAGSTFCSKRLLSLSCVCNTKALKKSIKLPLEITDEFLKKRQHDKEYPNSWQERQNRVTATLDSLKAKGFRLSEKDYNPPENVKEQLHEMSQDVFQDKLEPIWEDTSLEDRLSKFQILTRCEANFDHAVPNSLLYKMQKLSDVIEYYRTPVEGKSAYDKLIQNRDLPINLHVISEPARFNLQTDTFFGGVSAYPGTTTYVTGLKTRKKYKGHKGDFKWPDV